MVAPVQVQYQRSKDMNEKNKEVIINALTHSFQFVMGVILDDQARLARYEAVPA